MHTEAFFINRFHAQKHVLKPERLPKPEHLLVTQEDIAARLHVVLFLNPPPCNSLTDFESLFRLNEGDIVDQEDTRFSNLC